MKGFYESSDSASARGESPAGLQRRDLADVAVRSLDEKTRTATFVAATEVGVRTWEGREHLRMAGARLTRFKANPVVLDGHDRSQVGAIVGRADVKVEGRELLAIVTFADTARAETAWQLVRGGFLRAVSVGFIPNRERTVELRDGETDGVGESMITGPAKVVKEWELFEISVVPVPADAGALARSFYLVPPPQTAASASGPSLRDVSDEDLGRILCGR